MILNSSEVLFHFIIKKSCSGTHFSQSGNDITGEDNNRSAVDGFPGRLTLEDLQSPDPGQPRGAYSHPEQRPCACVSISVCRVRC